MGKRSILLAGFVGGLLPYLLGMAREAVGGTPARETFLYLDVGYWVGMLLFGLIGAVVVFFFGETELKKALTMGVTAPGILLGLGAGATDRLTTSVQLTSAPVAVSGFLVRPAMAQPAAPVQQGHDTLWVRLQGLDSVAGARADLVVLGPSPTVTFGLTPSSPQVAISRSAARGFYLVVEGVRTDTVQLSAIRRDTLTLRVTIRDRGFLSGFARTFGVRSVAQRQVIVSEVKGP